MIGAGFQRATRFALTIDGSEYRAFDTQIVDYEPPGVTQAAVKQSGPRRDIPWPGTKLEFDPLQVSAIVTAGMANYITMYNWMRNNANADEVHDIVVIGYGGNGAKVFGMRYHDAFPVGLALDQFTTTDESDSIIKFAATFEYADLTFE
jgi:hypothetical protein